MRLTRVAVGVGVLVTIAAAAFTATAGAHHAPSLPAVNVQPPFSGYWDRFGYAPPSSHHIVYGGDWSVDMYRSPGSTVRVRAWPVSQQGGVAYRIAEVRRACGSGVYSHGGNRVKVDFHYAGKHIGHAWYAHLANVAVAPGQWVPHGALLGYTARFTYSSCYKVTSDAGVHVHFELFSNRHYACYIRRSAGAWVDYWGVIGRIGGSYAYAIRRACP